LFFPIAFSIFLDVMVQHPELALFSGWEDTAFNTVRGDVAWSDESFENGWTIAWLYGQSDSAGFEISNTTLILGATFNGDNNNYKGGISGIIVKKDINGLMHHRLHFWLFIPILLLALQKSNKGRNCKYWLLGKNTIE
jgi:hypothetical protein